MVRNMTIADYEEEKTPKKDKVRMHSFIEGICIEWGNFKNFKTYTADPSALYRDNIKLKDIKIIKMKIITMEMKTICYILMILMIQIVLEMKMKLNISFHLNRK